jgi:hypothetical protein
MSVLLRDERRKTVDEGRGRGPRKIPNRKKFYFAIGSFLKFIIPIYAVEKALKLTRFRSRVLNNIPTSGRQSFELMRYVDYSFQQSVHSSLNSSWKADLSCVSGAAILAVL